LGRPVASSAFLVSCEGSCITGQTIYACGGLTLYLELRGDGPSRE
jgi:hypothetical protein